MQSSHCLRRSNTPACFVSSSYLNLVSKNICLSTGKIKVNLTITKQVILSSPLLILVNLDLRHQITWYKISRLTSYNYLTILGFGRGLWLNWRTHLPWWINPGSTLLHAPCSRMGTIPYSNQKLVSLRIRHPSRRWSHRHIRLQRCTRNFEGLEEGEGWLEDVEKVIIDFISAWVVLSLGLDDYPIPIMITLKEEVSEESISLICWMQSKINF